MRFLSLKAVLACSVAAWLATLAAPAQAEKRVALVVDGLNEAERPHEWRDELAKVEPG